MLSRFRHWFAGLPITIVAANSLMPALVLSYTWSMHWTLLLAVVPILAWAILQRT